MVQEEKRRQRIDGAIIKLQKMEKVFDILQFLRKFMYHGNQRFFYLFKKVDYFKEVDDAFKIRQCTYD